MRDAGVQKAIAAAGGVNALARLLRIKSSSVCGWRRVPSERVLPLEKVTGVARHELRPDLYPRDAKRG